jgi:hypothetical protein
MRDYGKYAYSKIDESSEKLNLTLTKRFLCVEYRSGAVAEQADAGDLKSSGLNTLVGSIPTRPMKFLKR